MSNTKRIFSHSFNRAVKRLTLEVKTLRGLKRIPNAPSRPAKSQEAQEKYDAKWAALPDKKTIRFFAEPFTLDETRRSRS